MDLLDKIVQYEIYTARLPVRTVATDLLLCTVMCCSNGLGAFAELRKSNITFVMSVSLLSVCLSVCLSTWNSSHFHEV